jgi:hypothetical protein
VDDQQRERFRSAVDRKKERSKAASEQASRGETDSADALPDEQSSLIERGRPQDTRDARAKSDGHRKKTADKWNQ